MPQPSREGGRYGEDADRWKARYQRACDEYTKGQIGEPTFRAMLDILGFRGQEVDAEVGLHAPGAPR